MTFNLNTKPYACYNTSRVSVYSGTYQQCLNYQSDSEEDLAVDKNVLFEDSEEVLELEDLPIDYSYEDIDDQDYKYPTLLSDVEI